MRKDFIKRHKENFFHEVTSLGGYLFCFLVILFFLILNKFLDAAKLVFGFALIYAITIIIRSFYFKNRPIKFKYNSFVEKIDAASFPSLHAARTTFVFAYIAGYFQNAIVCLVSAAIILLVLYSRIHLKRHDAKDVIAGSVIAILVFFLIKFHF